MLAYLDANSGSLILSAIAAGFAGVVVVAKMGWRRFTMLFSAQRRAEFRADKEARQATAAASDAAESA